MKELEEMADATGMDCLLMRQGEDDVAEFWNASRDQLLALANAIEAKAAAKEREACARECEAVPVRAGYSGMQKFAWEAGTSDCAEAIRARGAADGK